MPWHYNGGRGHLTMSNIVEVLNDAKIIEILTASVIEVNGGGGGGATNLSYTASSTQGIITSDTGTDATIIAGSNTNASLMLPADKTKLDELVTNATHTGDVTGSTALTIANNAVTLAKMATMATASVLGRRTAGTGNVEVISNANLKTDLALNNVDNTSDANKPVSTATQTALNAKENTITAGTTAQYFRGDKTFQTLDKTAVGLSNVDNTSDLNKPISTAVQTALNAKQNTITTGTISQYFRGDLSLATLNKTAVGLSNVVNADTTTTANITDSSNKRFITDAQQTVVSNTSGTNTGDNAVNSLYSGLATSKQDTLVSGTNIKTINGTSVLGSGDIVISGSGLTQQQVMRLAL